LVESVEEEVSNHEAIAPVFHPFVFALKAEVERSADVVPEVAATLRLDVLVVDEEVPLFLVHAEVQWL